MATVLSLRGISKRFGSLLANDDISLDLQSGEVLGLLGENGAGKSTLVSILFGHYEADSGTVEVFGKTLTPGRPREALAAGVGMVHQHFTLADNLSVMDNVLLGTQSLWERSLPLKQAREKLRDLSQRFGLPVRLDAQVSDLSVGEKQRVEILKVLYRGARLLVLDEPTAVLTPQESEQLFLTLRQMVSEGLAIILISHKLDEVLRNTQRIAVLRSGKLVSLGASDEFTRQTLALAMVGTQVVQTRRQAGDGSLAPEQRRPEPLLRLTNINAGSSAAGLRKGLRNASLALYPGRIVAIAGVSGNGQQTLAQLLFGLIRASQGEITLDGKPLRGDGRALRERGIAMIPQDRRHLGIVGEMSVWENAAAESLGQAGFSRFGWLSRRQARDFCARLVKQFDIRLAHDGVSAASLSGGNIQKLIVGRALCAHPDIRLIVAEQPSWGLDVGAIKSVHDTLIRACDNGAAVLLISEDLDEVLALADEIAVIHEGQLTAQLRTDAWSREQLGLAMAGRLHENSTRSEASLAN